MRENSKGERDASGAEMRGAGIQGTSGKICEVKSV
jgi:hypothetical protein